MDDDIYIVKKKTLKEAFVGDNGNVVCTISRETGDKKYRRELEWCSGRCH